ncbi:ABC transporter permease [Orrella daihaiensis]|uniref:ABC transporter permease n=1 Tax=Orrella daihaiensis TaxID=2782176 RepID=A0ABY4AHG7_9BURK|nr:ABC transporter permease [Orrella daihaiensis]UOD49523.1 ABC transporter permease [Orrella daihaiensis]
MLSFLIRRFAQAFLVIAVMVVLVFFGVNVVGDPIWMLISPEMDQQAIDQTAAALGLDKPIGEQFIFFLQGLFEGNLGRSFVHGDPAIELILSRMGATMELAIVALMMAIVIGLPLGMYAGLYPERRSSRFIMSGSILGFSLPTFWVGLMLIMLFSVMLGWLPASGRGPTTTIFGITTSLTSWQGWQHIFLPALNLALLKISLMIRLARAGTREAMLMDYVKFARAKGLSDSRIIGLHVLKNILIPIVTVLGLEFGSLVAFSVVTETIFSWPGMGKLLLEAIQRLDRPVIVAYVMVVVVLFVVINLIVDVLYSVLDPRVRLTDAKG